jgi:tetratricopeptide (TPR) repeat protein
MIAQLGQTNPKRLGVIARTSSNQFKGAKKSIAEIGRELQVHYVLEGSVRRDGKRVRITAQLIEVADQTHIWSETYDREFSNVLGIQHDVAREIGRALAFELLPEHRFAPPSNPEAHESYLLGRFHWGMRHEEGIRRALACFEHSIDIDPQFDRAYSGIADCYGLLCWFGAVAPRDAGPKAAAAAARALDINDSRSETHASLGLIRFWFDWNWIAAEQEFRRAIELNPSYAAAHQWYAAFLSAMGRLDESATELHRARELDPLSLIINVTAADPFFFGRHYDRAIAHLRALLDHEPRFFPALFNLGRVYVQKGMYDDAITAFEKAAQFSGNREAYPALAHAYALAGMTPAARKILDEMGKPANGRYLASPLLARVHLGLGEIDQAFALLQKGVDEKSFWMIFLKMDPLYDPIRQDPRFHRLLRLVGFSS